MPAKIDTILANARIHTEEVIKPNVDTWNEAGVWPRNASDKASAQGVWRKLNHPKHLPRIGLSGRSDHAREL